MDDYCEDCGESGADWRREFQAPLCDSCVSVYCDEDDVTYDDDEWAAAAPASGKDGKQ